MRNAFITRNGDFDVNSRGRRLIRNSIDELLKFLPERCASYRRKTSIGYKMELSSVLSRRQIQRIFASTLAARGSHKLPQLRDEKNFVRVGILHFRSWRKSFHVNVFAGEKGLSTEMRFAWEQEFRTDNLPSLLSSAQPLELVKPHLLRGHLEAEQVHSD